jgi:MinD superfamily P-loop ATPase
MRLLSLTFGRACSMIVCMSQEACAMGKAMPKLDEELCNRCGLCVQACPCGSVELDEESIIFSCPDVCATATEMCDCGCVCEEVCPTGAIAVAFEIVLGEGEKAKSGKPQEGLRSTWGKANGKDL